jgi:hypothetical protein
MASLSGLVLTCLAQAAIEYRPISELPNQAAGTSGKRAGGRKLQCLASTELRHGLPPLLCSARLSARFVPNRALNRGFGFIVEKIHSIRVGARRSFRAPWRRRSAQPKRYCPRGHPAPTLGRSELNSCTTNLCRFDVSPTAERLAAASLFGPISWKRTV